MKLALLILRSLRFHIVFSPADATAQLAAMLHSHHINAIWSSFDASLRDVPLWIHYFDIESKRALLLRSHPALIRSLLNSPTFPGRICSPFLVHQCLRWWCQPPLVDCEPRHPDLTVLSFITSGLLPLPNRCDRLFS
jgi:hypothetical protein